MTSGGERVAAVLAEQGVRWLFTLCGGHISPILVACRARGVRVVDVRHEQSAVFAADAASRLTGVPGVAAVTAGPGVTNALTALKTAEQAGSALVLLGGATATLLRGKGSLQDVDQAAVVAGCVKWQGRAARLKEVAPLLRRAFEEAMAGVPGPVFLELPVDVLYPEAVVRDWYAKGAGKGDGLGQRALRVVIGRHLKRLLAAPDHEDAAPAAQPARDPPGLLVGQVGRMLDAAARPALVVGSQALRRAPEAHAVARAVDRLGAPVWLAGGARGLLGRGHPLAFRHRRKEALREADLVLLAGVPCDFRLDYGRAIGKDAKVVAVGLGLGDLVKNRVPTLPVPADPGRLLQELGERAAEGGERRTAGRWAAWLERLRAREAERDQEIARQAGEPVDGEGVHPLRVCQAVEAAAADDAVLVGDGGDFVASVAYVVRPRGPLGWLDAGPFGTLGPGGGFALAAALANPGREVWLLWGDGACGLSLAEVDSWVRHGLPVIAVVGNDGAWSQIARDQVTVLGDAVGTELRQTDYHRAAEGLGAVGLVVRREDELAGALAEAKRAAAAGRPVVVNVLMGRSRFREGSLSL